ncbi:CPBP family intramembrane glutamic endopeptidase [Crocinitomix algicola]|uniref:CPBP family intramembrane glutamic endopeptidase n=1 Tax=Crocinitomix algicola TaxID=1740263 RepID=UPI0008720617|nr:CPBP family intramembrane glutamic endopeptidase [Crocinitomix algicola]
MKIFVNYIISHFKEEFDLKLHLLIAVFLSIALYFNYWYYPYRVYSNLTVNYFEDSRLILYLFLLFILPFLFTTVLIYHKNRAKNDKNNYKKYLIYGTIGMIFLALDCSYFSLQYLVELYDIDPFVNRWIRACISNLSSLITIIIPLYIIYFSVKHFKPEFYGLRLNGAKIVPYFWLILFMLPLIYIASFQPDFLESYPSYPRQNFEYLFLDTDQWITAGIYELCYGFDFISVELFFRGFLVIALSRFLGKDAILPMVTVYCFLHFGKPAGEAISSIFGGYILGILAYRSRNIFGGLIAHLGVAWGMEFMAYLNI